MTPFLKINGILDYSIDVGGKAADPGIRYPGLKDIEIDLLLHISYICRSHVKIIIYSNYSLF